MENTSQSSSNPIPQGCGPNPSPQPQIIIHVSPTTGGDYYFSVEPDITVENFKKLISKRLKVARDRICLLFRDKQLQDGNLVQHGISDGSRITLLPNVETGLTTQRPEIGIMQALESLNDNQVNEFLCGKAPLNLSMRLGDHMMLIQLQLSTVTPKPPNPAPPPNSSEENVEPPSSPPTSPRPHSPSIPSSPPSSPRPSSPSIPPSPSSSSLPIPSSPPLPLIPSVLPNPPSLLQASRNLQHTLRRLSADVFSGGRDRGRRESIYSGTFSGALNPALQDPKGRPRRDVSTIVHILNDLLCSVPELRRVNRRGSEEPLAPSPEPQDEPMTSTCSEDQNLRTRGKLEHLRLVMGERRERRRQRKQKPYSLPQSDTDTVTA